MEAVNQLLVKLETHRFAFCFIGAGYEDQVDEFLSVNPGLAGRFNRKLRFESYVPAEIVEIGRRYAEPRATTLDEAAREAFLDAATTVRNYTTPGGQHGIDAMHNGRFARNVIERAEGFRDTRVVAQKRWANRIRRRSTDHHGRGHRIRGGQRVFDNRAWQPSSGKRKKVRPLYFAPVGSPMRTTLVISACHHGGSTPAELHAMAFDDSARRAAGSGIAQPIWLMSAVIALTATAGNASSASARTTNSSATPAACAVSSVDRLARRRAAYRRCPSVAPGAARAQQPSAHFVIAAAPRPRALMNSGSDPD